MTSVAFLCHPYHRGGVTSWMAAAARESALQGIKTYFVTVTPRSPFISSGGKPCMIELFDGDTGGIHIIAPKVSFEFELGSSEYRSDIYKKAILAHIPKGTPVIVSDDYAVWQAAAIIADQFPMIGVLHSDDDAYYHLANIFQPYVSKFTAVSRRIAEKANIKSHEISVIPCGIDTKIFHKPALITRREIEITWIGRIEEEQKRVSDITLIAQVLKENKIPFHIKVLGTGPQTDSLNAQISAAGLEKEIKLKGWQSGLEIRERLSQSDILLQTSNYEGMSVAVMEALAAGCGIVSSRVSGIEDYENSAYAHNCLRVYTIGNIKEATDKIISLYTIEKEERAATAMRFAADEFSIEACVLKYVNMITNALPGTHKLELPQPQLWINIKSRTLALIRKIKFEIRRR